MTWNIDLFLTEKFLVLLLCRKKNGKIKENVHEKNKLQRDVFLKTVYRVSVRVHGYIFSWETSFSAIALITWAVYLSMICMKVPWIFLRFVFEDFTTHGPTTHDPRMHDSCINYPNQFKLCSKNYKHYVNIRAIFCWTKDRELLFHASKCLPHHVKFIGVFLELINIYIVTESISSWSCSTSRMKK